MNADQMSPLVTRRQDYRAPAWVVPDIALDLDLDADRTLVRARLSVARGEGPHGPLVLNGEGLRLRGLGVNGKALPPGGYTEADGRLIIPMDTDAALVETEVEIEPAKNTQLMGLYASGGILCTQCEAEGFRRITYFPDRPDVLSRYDVVLRADKARYPVLLSNGNPAPAEDLGDGRHAARWTDPHPKPCYLFAAVAGDLASLEDTFTTMSGRRVRLAIWVRPGDEERCRHAMWALKQAMAWDERVYGREYDLDMFNIVAVDDFNFGAMENKGLNIFNSKYILADQDTATDNDFDAIAAVVAHEYFHNWTGNRITCRDWFQLSLKEGLTVFRDQQFSADMGSPAVKRIEDVRALRAGQFPEDAGPLAHPIRPESYQEISNFYTATVYNKGAEVIRMMHRLLGPERFRAGTDLYFERHDGEAATCEDWVRAIEDGGGIDLGQFRLWYSQAGTPDVRAVLAYDAADRRATLELTQTIPTTPGQSDKAPMHIPLEVALLGRESGARLGEARIAQLRGETERLSFEGIDEPPVLSINRGFTAPVRVESNRTPADFAFLSAHDDDPFARYEAMQELMMNRLLDAVRGGPMEAGPVVEAVRRTLADQALDHAFIAEAVIVPSEAMIAERLGRDIDPDAVKMARDGLRLAILDAVGRERFADLHHSLGGGRFELTPEAKGRRRLKNIALAYLFAAPDAEAAALAGRQFETADNMTDRLAALSLLVEIDGPAHDAALAEFYRRFRESAGVLDKWFSVQVGAPRADAVEQAQALAAHADFSAANPNRFRALVGAFAANQWAFHRADGAGYRFVADWLIAVDRLNPQTAARFVAPFGRWRRMEPRRAALMQAELQRILGTEGISKDVYEMASKSLA